MAEVKKSKKETADKKSKSAVETKKRKVTKKELKDGPIKDSDQDTTQAVVEKEVKNTTEPDQATETKAAAKPIAKAGKRSAKALKEAEEKQIKEAKKAEAKDTEAETTSAAPKHKPRTAEDRLKTRGKKYREAYKQVDRAKTYSLKEAMQLTTSTSTVKFDATVELHIRLGVDPKQADQNIRGTVVLPSGSGKTVRVAVFAEGDDIKAAQKAGADIAAEEEFLQQLDKGQFDFDVLIATPALMARLGKYARTLGPKGLMPNPKSGTVTKDVAKAVGEAKSGRVEFRVDSAGIVHVGIGKVSFGADKLLDNARAILTNIKAAKPSSLKGNYVLSVYATSTMGPSVQIDLSDANNV
jgi:large subunit ribosomal protein L1